jgi:polyisoprenoid-binding protein YceI
MKVYLLGAGMLSLACGLWPFSGSARAQTLTFQVDKAGSRVYVRVDKATRLGHSHGVMGSLSAGQVSFAGPGQLEFDLGSFVADSPQARQHVGLEPDFSQSDAGKVNANMKGPDCLDVAHYPKATFAIASLTPLDGQAVGAPGRYRVQGRFTLHGVTQPAQFDATLANTAERGVLSLRGQFRIAQTSHGIQPYSALGGLIRVADELTIHGDLILRGASAP